MRSAPRRAYVVKPAAAGLTLYREQVSIIAAQQAADMAGPGCVKRIEVDGAVGVQLAERRPGRALGADRPEAGGGLVRAEAVVRRGDAGQDGAHGAVEAERIGLHIGHRSGGGEGGMRRVVNGEDERWGRRARKRGGPLGNRRTPEPASVVERADQHCSIRLSLLLASSMPSFLYRRRAARAGWMDALLQRRPRHLNFIMWRWNSGLGVFAGLTWSTQLGSSLYAFCASDWVQFIRCTEKIGWCSEQTAISGALLCPAQGMSARPAVLVFKSHWSFRIMVY
jgi:hypothetical protein